MHGPQLRERTCAARVLDLHRQADRRREQVVDVDVPPPEGRRVQDPHRRVLDHPGDGHADALAGGNAAMVREQRTNPNAQRRRKRLRIALGRESDHAAERFAKKVGRQQVGLTCPNVDGDDGAAARVDVEKRRLSPANGLAGGAFDDEAALEEVADDEADASPADTHRAGEVGARDRLIRADEIQHDLPVDLSRGALGGDLKANRIDLSH